MKVMKEKIPIYLLYRTIILMTFTAQWIHLKLELIIESENISLENKLKIKH
jgi:hypothetical protein